MCGFAAHFDPGAPAPPHEWLAGAADLLAHRGPDDAGFHSEPGIGMAFRRLSIVDLAHGAQPMSNEDGSVWIVFNGEIYNHLSLRTELETCGHRYRTRSDTETIVHAYEEWGERCVDRLRGMFAFAIWDRRKHELFCARDRFGIKPLYHTRVGSAFACGSELKALFAFPGVEHRVRPDALVEHLQLRYVASPATLIAGIEKLPPGHWMRVRGTGTEIRRYWHLEYEPKHALTDEEALTQLDARLSEAVALRLMSEVPLGALLSGGIDSSLVVAMMRRHMNRPVQTYSVGFDAPGPYSELPYARQVSAHLGTDHHEILVGADDIARELPRLVWQHDEPVSEPAAIPTYLVSRLARESVTVVLTGEGGDELFAGYPKYAAEPVVRGIAAMPAPLVRLLANGATRHLPFGLRKWQVLARSAQFRDESERLASWFAGFAGDEHLALLAPDLRAQGHAPSASFAAALRETTATRALDRMLDADVRLWLTDDLLMKMDKMSMAASVEARVPMLDHPLAEWAVRLPSRMKIRGMTGKYLLRQLAYRLLPRSVIDRPKVGFTVPLAPWFRGPLRELLTDTLLSATCLDRGYYDPAVLRRHVEEHVSGRRDRARELWMLLTLECWHREYVDHRPRRTEPFVPPPRTAGQGAVAV